MTAPPTEPMSGLISGPMSGPARVVDVLAAYAGSPVVTVPVASVWSAPYDGTPVPDDLVTQALLGEPVVVVGDRGDWLEVRLPLQPHPGDPRGYPGWLPADEVGGRLPQAGSWGVLSQRLALHPAPRVLSAGTWLPVADGGLVLPDGSTIARPAPAEGDVVDVAAQWLGLPYLWGGLSGHGLDCSGLVHLSARVLGRVVPRDAKDQASALPRAEGTARGDLLFFWTEARDRIRHVALVLDDEHFLHAPCTGRRVEVLSRRTPPYDRDLAWATAPPA